MSRGGNRRNRRGRRLGKETSGRHPDEKSIEPIKADSPPAVVVAPSPNFVESFAAGTGTTGDTRLMRRAVEGQWPINVAYKAKIMARLERIAAGETGASERERQAATLTLLKAEQINWTSFSVAARADEEPKEPGTVNVNVGVGVNVGPLASASDDELRRLAGIGTPTLGADAVPAGLLPAPTNGTANGFHRNGHH